MTQHLNITSRRECSVFGSPIGRQQHPSNISLCLNCSSFSFTCHSSTFLFTLQSWNSAIRNLVKMIQGQSGSRVGTNFSRPDHCSSQKGKFFYYNFHSTTHSSHVQHLSYKIPDLGTLFHTHAIMWMNERRYLPEYPVQPPVDSNSQISTSRIGGKLVSKG